jgi:hypothetical protein
LLHNVILCTPASSIFHQTITAGKQTSRSRAQIKSLLWRSGGYPVVEVVGTRTVRLLTSPQSSEYSFDCVAGETFTQEALFEGQSACTGCVLL